MEPATTLRFAAAARNLSREARRRGLYAPGFRSPPRVVGADRTLRRWVGGGGATIAVRVRGRAWVAVAADMVEGVVAANKLVGPQADKVRESLWEAIADDVAVPVRRVA